MSDAGLGGDSATKETVAPPPPPPPPSSSAASPSRIVLRRPSRRAARGSAPRCGGAPKARDGGGGGAGGAPSASHEEVPEIRGVFRCRSRRVDGAPRRASRWDGGGRGVVDARDQQLTMAMAEWPGASAPPRHRARLCPHALAEQHDLGTGLPCLLGGRCHRRLSGWRRNTRRSRLARAASRSRRRRERPRPGCPCQRSGGCPSAGRSCGRPPPQPEGGADYVRCLHAGSRPDGATRRGRRLVGRPRQR